MLGSFQNLIEEVRKEDKRQREIYKIKQIFEIQDYAKELLLNSITKRQEERARNFLKRINVELGKKYIL